MPAAFASVAALIFALLGGLHVYWALGGRWGADVALPHRPPAPGADSTAPPRFTFTPTPLGTLAVALALFAAAATLLGRVGWLGGVPGLGALPAGLWAAGTWALAALFLARAIGEFRYVGFFKRVRNTAFARLDTRLFSPLCLALAVLAAATALTSP